MKSASLYGLVLAGGRSTRMGHDKGLLHYHGKPQREYLFDLLGEFCTHVFTSCRKDQEISPSLNPISDKHDFESPLNGILSAFEENADVAWLAVAVDMPFVNNQALRFLTSHRDTSKVATCFYDSEGKLPEPLFTIWEPTACSRLKKFVGEGSISPRDFLAANDVSKLTYQESRFHVNVNTPEEFQKVKTGNFAHLSQKK